MKTLSYFTIIILACFTMLSSLSGSDLLSLIEDRKEKEASIWRQETLAQEHDEAFIRLWDELRSSDEPISVLQAFSFEVIKLGDLSDSTTLDHGIQSQTMGPANRTIPWLQWSRWLGQMKEYGFSLHQSEWHHKEFVENPAGQNHSIFSFSLHVEHLVSQRRIIADGRIKVLWKKEKNEEGTFVPDTIKVTELEILQRLGRPFFKRLGVFDIAPEKRGPVWPMIWIEMGIPKFSSLRPTRSPGTTEATDTVWRVLTLFCSQTVVPQFLGILIGMEPQTW